MHKDLNWALIIPLANEEITFSSFIRELTRVLDSMGSGNVYLVVDNASKDNTLTLCNDLSNHDNRYKTVWAPENKNVVDAYIRGYKEALKLPYSYMIEMDAGLSHHPNSLPVFIEHLENGYECVFGSRFVRGGSMGNSPLQRRSLSIIGTIVSNILLGTNLHDMTSGYQGFTREVVQKFTLYPLKSRAHFYQTEIRYLLRKRKHIEIPIAYSSPSPRVSKKALKNAFQSLMHYTWQRITLHEHSL